MGFESIVMESGITMADFLWLVIILVELIMTVILYVLLEKTVRWAIRNTDFRITDKNKKEKEKPAVKKKTVNK